MNRAPLNTPAHIRLIRHLIGLGASISVDGQPFSTDQKAIVADVEACGMVCIRTMLHSKNEWAQLVTGPYEDPDETVADFSCNGEIEKWFNRSV